MGGLPETVAIGDLNGDGKPDIAVPSLYADSVYIYFNAGTTPVARVEFTAAAERGIVHLQW